MPPRIPIVHTICTHICNTSSTPVALFRLFSSTPTPQKKLRPSQRDSQDPYAEAYRKSLGGARVKVREDGTVEPAGDPVRGQDTDFLRSLDKIDEPLSKIEGTDQYNTSQVPHLLKKDLPYVRENVEEKALFQTMHGNGEQPVNFNLDANIVATAVTRAQEMNGPSMAGLPSSSLTDDGGRNKELEELFERRQKHSDENDARAREAISKIINLQLGDAQDLNKVNRLKCIARFGRHNTDNVLKPPPGRAQDAPAPTNTRGGPDTGSSEVQVAILTTRIRALAKMLVQRPLDKHNKRSLRLLVHRRAKLLKYLRRKERGGPRWQHLVETMGLTDSTWKGEIVV